MSPARGKHGERRQGIILNKAMPARPNPTGCSLRMPYRSKRNYRTLELFSILSLRSRKRGWMPIILIWNFLSITSVSDNYLLSILTRPPRHQLLLCCMYRPPDSPTSSNATLMWHIRNLYDDYPRDFYATLVSWPDMSVDAPANSFDSVSCFSRENATLDKVITDDFNDVGDIS